MSAKEDFQKEAGKITRDGIRLLMKYLDTTDFYEAPASVRFHGACPQGLLLHSLSVTDLMREINEITDSNLPEESILICGLFHDICKIGFYIEDSEEASSAQIRYLQDLCESRKERMPSKDYRTKAYISKMIDALLKEEPVPKYATSYKIKDQLPMGHGEKSVYIIQKYMLLTDEEALAIRWHLGGFDPAAYNSTMGNPSIQAFKETKLLPLISGADILASYLLDEW